MSAEQGGQAQLLLTGARQTTWLLVGKVVRARGHLPVPEAGLQHPGSVARLQEDRSPLVPVLALDLVLPPDAAAVLGYPLLRPVWESCTTTVVLRMLCTHTLRVEDSDSHIVLVPGSLHMWLIYTQAAIMGLELSKQQKAVTVLLLVCPQGAK